MLTALALIDPGNTDRNTLGGFLVCKHTVLKANLFQTAKHICQWRELLGVISLVKHYSKSECVGRVAWGGAMQAI